MKKFSTFHPLVFNEFFSGFSREKEKQKREIVDRKYIIHIETELSVLRVLI